MLGCPTFQGRPTSHQGIAKRKTEKEPEVEKGARFRSFFEVQHKGKGKAKGKFKWSKGKHKELVLADWATGKGQPNIKFKHKKGQKGKGLYRRRGMLS